VQWFVDNWQPNFEFWCIEDVEPSTDVPLPCLGKGCLSLLPEVQWLPPRFTTISSADMALASKLR
jgi:hypothetical protein